MSLQPDTRATARAISEIADLIPHYTDIYRTAFAVKAACSGLLIVNFAVYASRRRYTQVT